MFRIFSLIAFCVLVLTLSIRGILGNPTSNTLSNPQWRDDGPLELSPERGRFALTYSIVEDRSFSFSLPIARFIVPDLGYKNGQYVSLFAPGISFLVIPGYLIGKLVGISQVGVYSVIALFAILNVILIQSIAKRLGADAIPATIGGLLFLFATPAFAYAVNLYQHHVSTFLVLLSIYVLLRFKGYWSLAIIWFLIAASIPIDYPNVFFMIPIGIYALGRMFEVKKQEVITVSIYFPAILTVITIIFPLVFFFWFNKSSYGNPFQLSGTIASVKAIGEDGLPVAPKLTETTQTDIKVDPNKQKKSAVGFFDSRSLLRGFQVQFTSQDRGILIFTPVILFIIPGIYFLYKKNGEGTSLLVSVIGMNVLLYAMWGDPWGGWAFGSRYLIPTYAIAAIFISVGLTAWKKKIIFLIFFLLVVSYSIGVNTLGAITSSRNPPSAELPALEKISGIKQPYSYDRNINFLKYTGSKSFIYQSYLYRYFSAQQYYIFLIALIILPVSGLIVYYHFLGNHKK